MSFKSSQSERTNKNSPFFTRIFPQIIPFTFIFLLHFVRSLKELPPCICYWLLLFLIHIKFRIHFEIIMFDDTFIFFCRSVLSFLWMNRGKMMRTLFNGKYFSSVMSDSNQSSLQLAFEQVLLQTLFATQNGLLQIKRIFSFFQHLNMINIVSFFKPFHHVFVPNPIDKQLQCLYVGFSLL